MRQSLFCLILRKIFYFLPTIHHEKLSQKHLHIFNQPPMNCNILFFVRTFNHSFKHLICPISKHILRQDCPVVNVSLATVLFHNGKGNLFFEFGADDRTCSEQSERNSETGEFIRYSEASAAQGQVANKVCRQCNLHCRKSVIAV